MFLCLGWLDTWTSVYYHSHTTMCFSLSGMTTPSHPSINLCLFLPSSQRNSCTYPSLSRSSSSSNSSSWRLMLREALPSRKLRWAKQEVVMNSDSFPVCILERRGSGRRIKSNTQGELWSFSDMLLVNINSINHQVPVTKHEPRPLYHQTSPCSSIISILQLLQCSQHCRVQVCVILSWNTHRRTQCSASWTDGDFSPGVDYFNTCPAWVGVFVGLLSIDCEMGNVTVGRPVILHLDAR